MEQDGTNHSPVVEVVHCQTVLSCFSRNINYIRPSHGDEYCLLLVDSLEHCVIYGPQSEYWIRQYSGSSRAVLS